MIMVSVSHALQLTAPALSCWVALVAVVLAGISDVRTNMIPNWLTFGLIAGGLLFNAVLPMGGGWWYSISGLALGGAVLLPLFAQGGVGAGDVKLLAGIGCWVGWHDTLAIFLVFGLLAGVYSIAFLARDRMMATQLPDKRQSQTDSRAIASGLRVDEVLERECWQRQRSVLPLAPIMAMAMLILTVLKY